ncbi:MAG: zinc-binding dehydrogenase [Verrucomicrobiota bacterium]|nr:zinc-binding dehydrogenase [Verrucomicrobiota bacterium]
MIRFRHHLWVYACVLAVAFSCSAFAQEVAATPEPPAPDGAAMMKAVRLHAYGGREVLQFEDAPRPRPKEDEILIRVLAAGVNPVDAKIRQGMFARMMGTKLPLIPGLDVSGLVEEAGAKVTRFKKGDPVYACLSALRQGAYAEFAVAKVPELDKSIAVLPLLTRSEDEANALLASGIRDEVTSALAKIKALKLAPDPGSMATDNAGDATEEAASRPDVAYVVEGDIRQDPGDRVCVSLKLMDVRNNRPLWSESFDRTAVDLPALAKEVAAEAVAVIRTTVAELEAPESEASAKPKGLSFEGAAVMPVAAATAWQALVELANLSPGQTVLIHGGSGGVGVFAIQIAKARGAKVIATASAANQEFMRDLGADRVIDYNATRFEEVVKEVDVVLDSVAGETLKRSYGVVKKGGIIVSLLEPPDKAELDARGIRGTAFMVSPSAALLSELTKLVEAKKLKPVISKTFPLADVAKAHEAIETGHTRGKIVLRVADEPKD